MRRKTIVGISLGFLASGLAIQIQMEGGALESRQDPRVRAYALTGAPKVKQAYQAWVTAHEERGGDRNIRLALRYNRGLSVEFTEASGTAELDLIDGWIAIRVSGLPAGEFDAWMVDNRPGAGASVRPQPSDVRIHLGKLRQVDGVAVLEADLERDLIDQVQADLIVIAREGAGSEAGLLYGASPLFQRMYTALSNPSLLSVSDFVPRLEQVDRSLFGEKSALAGEIVVDPDVVFDALVAQGADLFINETFEGNGRTCATCHPLDQNTQLTVSQIAALPDNDPLFAAEFIPALAFTPAGPKFEVPVLMRRLALIVENQDGDDNLANKFNMRSIPHTLGLSTSLTPNPGDLTTTPPNQRTGWSGDGAPGNGTLRDFATGAVTQHFPLTLGRDEEAGDFRLPTDPELNAMEAFQLSLGRSVDPVLPLPLLDPIVAKGQMIFMSSAARCNGCHNNASANVSSGTNRNFNTGVENQVDRPILVVLQALGLDLTPGFPENLFPRDGGFGASPGDPVAGFGNGTFNTPPLVEAADTGPFFHDNQVRTIEGAVAFYNSTAFASSPSGTPAIDLQPTQIEAIAAFLRVLNSLENIRASRDLAVTLQGLTPPDRIFVGPALLLQAREEIDDAIRVLSEVDLHPGAVADLAAARALIPNSPVGTAIQPSNASAIIALLDSARAQMRS